MLGAKPFRLVYQNEIHDDAATVALEIVQTLGSLPEAWARATCDIYGLVLLESWIDDSELSLILNN